MNTLENNLMVKNNEKGLNFEIACENKLAKLGFVEIYRTKNTDNGADIIATLGSTKYVFQCKNHRKPQ
jgi:HJR/Mrr/RecB family endonuclease